MLARVTDPRIESEMGALIVADPLTTPEPVEHLVSWLCNYLAQLALNPLSVVSGLLGHLLDARVRKTSRLFVIHPNGARIVRVAEPSEILLGNVVMSRPMVDSFRCLTTWC